MNLKRLFHALVLSGSALGAANCGGGMATDPPANAGSGAPMGTLLPDGGVATNPGMPGMPGGPAGW